MKDLHIIVSNKVATYLARDGEIVCGNNDYRIAFTFDGEWDGYEAKTARFFWGGKYIDVAFTGDTVPVPIISNTNTLTVGVYAGELCTTTPAQIPCTRSILCVSGGAEEEEYQDNNGKIERRLPLATEADDGKVLTVAGGAYVLKKGGGGGGTGADGASAYEIAVKHGFEGSEEEWLKSLEGAPGATGPTGPQGEPGTAGSNGKDGATGEKGADGVSATHSWNGTTLTITSASGTSSADLKGEKGDKGEQGEQGIQGEQGVQGEKGADGKDGTDGTDGTNGKDGKSAYAYAQDGGFTGTEAEFAEMLAGDVPPDYWQNALDEGTEAINTALCTAGYNKSAFLFYSDAHWNANSQMSPKLLKYLYEHTGMTKTFFGGDIVYDEGTEYETMAYLWEWRKQLKGLPNHHSVVGNHDDGNNTENNLFPEKYVYGYLLSAEETPDIVRGDGLYYYIDSPAEKTRYLFLDTAYKGATTEQQTFVREALIGTPEGWHIVAISHIWYDTIYTTTPPSVGDINPNASIFLTMFDNYNSRSGDFAECSGWVEFCIGGHTHRDYDGTSDTGIPIVLVETDSQDVRNGKSEAQYKYTAGTATESSVNGIIADYDNHKIYVVRIGRGESRDITVTNYVVEYTNQLPISTGTGTAIYGGDYDGNGVNDGYQQNTRLGSDGADRTGATGIHASGFIPVKQGEDVFFKNCQLIKSVTYNEIAFYKGDKTYINKREINDGFLNWGGVFDGTNLVKFNTTLPSSLSWDFSELGFIRVACNYLGADSIITVNEEIE